MTNHLARRVVLPRYVETILCDEGDPGATRIDLPNGKHYFCRPMHLPGETNRADGAPRWQKHQFDKYPVILRGDGTPWDEANMYKLSRLHSNPDPLASTRDISSTIDDLVAYRRFVEEEGLDWLDFPAFKEARPTYRFLVYLNDQVQTGTISHGVAQRRMNTIVSFYRWLMQEQAFAPAKPPWQEKLVVIPIRTRQGAAMEKVVRTTDQKVKGKPKENPFTPYISDGGRLRPLLGHEQDWLFEALDHLGNYELQLMHLLSMNTGARLETVLTVRRMHFWKSLEPYSQFGMVNVEYRPQSPQGFVAIRVGPGTLIDTKFNQNYRLYVPVWLYEKLHTYAHSEPATRRRQKAAGGDIDEQYLFLTAKKKQPWYVSMQAVDALAEVHSHRKSHITGRAVGHLVKQHIIPYIRAKYDPAFEYVFHWMRATFGMNEIERLLDKPKNPDDPNGEVWSLNDVLGWVQLRMHHSNLTTTEGYIDYRKQVGLARARAAQEQWEDALTEKMRKYADAAEKKSLLGSQGETP